MHSSVPLSHKLVAVVVAIATACGLYAYLRNREAQRAFPASLSFDSAAAEQLDPGIMRAHDPAVVLGQSILSDSVVAALVPQAGLSDSTTDHATAEFRSRVELTQPSAGLLWVRYRDPDPAQATATANAIANALAEWAPSATRAAPPVAPAQPAATPGPNAAPTSESTPASESVPASTAAPQHAPAAEPSLAAALGELHAQLSAADHRAGSESPLQSERDRQRYLESQVRAAQQRLSDLRSKFADSSSPSGGQARLAVIQHALARFWPSAAGLQTAGTSEAQLRYEREQLISIIDVVEQQQLAAQRAQAANSASANSPSQQTAPLVSQPQSTPAPAVQAPPASGAVPNPFHLERMAIQPARVDWWPSALIGCACGLLYFGLAFARYRSSAESDDLLDLSEETVSSPHRMITYAPDPADARAVTVETDSVETDPVETPSRRRASFTFDSDSISASVPDQSPSPEPIQGLAADTVLESPPETAIASTHTDRSEIASAADIVAFLRNPKEQDGDFNEKIAEMSDPWGDEVLRSLSQTSIARTLDAQAPLDARTKPEDFADAKGPARDERLPSSQPDRRAS